LVWTLAGGYGEDAWRHTARSLCWLFGGLEEPIASQSEQELARSRRIARQLTRTQLSTEDREDVILTPKDLMADLVGPSRRSKLLGFYTETGLETALERYGILSHVRSLGFGDLRVTLDPDYPTGHPGLGALKKLFLMLVMAGERLGFDGLQFCPSHYHVAAQARGILSFLHPEDAARFYAMEEALSGLPLAVATQVVHSGGLIDKRTGEPVEWKAAPMVLPISDRLERHVQGRNYQEQLEARASELQIVRAE
jgi:hypothetical protein